MSGTGPFGARLRAAMDARGPLVVGIDPHPRLLAAWGLTDDAAGLAAFSATVLEAAGEDVCALKPQSAFFERHGSAGIAVLEDLLARCRCDGILTVLDVKRGDIGSTMAAYADAYLRPGAPLEADAITVSPFLGVGSLGPALERVERDGKGVFVLALTSNPDGPSIQHARIADAGNQDSGADRGRAVAAHVADAVGGRNRAELEGSGGSLGSIGLVVGATVGSAPADLGIDLSAVSGPLLAPGIGAQGAGERELRTVFGDARPQVLAAVSRGILGAGPEPGRLRRAVRKYRAKAQDALLSR